MWGGLERVNRGSKGMGRMAAAGALALALGAGAQPGRAEQPDPPGAAALPPGVALIAPSPAVPATPVTANAGMGTGEAPREAAPVASGIDAAGNGAPAQPAVPAPAPTIASGTDAAGNGVDTAGNGAPMLAQPATPAPGPAVAGAAAPAAPASAAAAMPGHPVAPAAPMDAAGHGAPVLAQPAAPATAPAMTGTAQPVDAQANGVTVATPVPPAPAAAPGHDAPMVAQPVAPAPAAGSAVAGGDSVGNGAPAAATAQSAPAIPSAPAPAAPVDPLAPVAAEVTALIARPDAITSSKAEQQGLSTFYSARQGAPVFVDLKGFNARGQAVLARLKAAAEDGLDPDDYAVPSLAPGADPQMLARAELQLAVAALTYARQAQSGRFAPSRISEQVTPTREIPNSAAVLEALAQAPDANGTLQAYNPPHAGYKALRAKLATMTDTAPTPEVVSIKGGPLLRPGGRDPRVPSLRERLGLAAAGEDATYDPALVDAVKAFQESAGLNAEGIVGPATVEALNKDAKGAGTVTRADVIANMERWRWLPRDLGAQYVMVNIPEYLVRVFDDGKEVFETRIVVGKPETPTPLLSHDMEYVVVNPAWNIPPSIARKEMMPLLQRNPSALARQGIEVTQLRGGGYSFRQRPGANNALGRIKFMFPNDHYVYLHDTPARSLFANSRRAFSHGCMRLQDPLMFGEVIFGLGLPDANLTKERISKMLGTSERYINLKNHIPVHVVYFTTFVDGKGELENREDIYGLNAQVKSLLGLDGRRRLADGTSTRKR